MTLYSDKAYITQVNDAEHGLALLAALKDAIDASWEHCAELIAATQPRRAPRPLDVGTLLPRTNCRKCSEATCMAFVVALLQKKRELDECSALEADQGAALTVLLYCSYAPEIHPFFKGNVTSAASG
jgi:ArsR family metal-binding transcriptional regulator